MASPRSTRVLLALGSTLLALVLAEQLLGGPLRPKLVESRDEAWQARQEHLAKTLYEADEELVYVPREGGSVVMDYGIAAFNTQGLREHRRVGREPPEGAQRVAVLGDSLVWGELLGREDTLPAVLDTRLGDAAEVLNFGVSGYDTWQEEQWYARQVRAYEPDVLVLVFCLNDLLTMSRPYHHFASPDQLTAYQVERDWIEDSAPLRNESVSRLWLEERRGEGSQVMAALRHIKRWHQLFTLPGGYTDEILLSFDDGFRRARMEESLRRLGGALEKDDVDGILVISPALYWWHRYQWDEAHAIVRAAGEVGGFTVVDPLEQWRDGDPEALRFPGDNLHYTPLGIETLADVVEPELRSVISEREARQEESSGRGAKGPGSR